MGQMSFKALNETQSTHPNQNEASTGLTLSASTARLLWERALHPISWFSDASYMKPTQI